MTYVQPNSASQKASTLVIVAALHAVGIYAVITSLGFSILPKGTEPPVEATFYPLDPPDPKPTPTVKPTETTRLDRPIFVPPPPGGTQPNPLSTGNPFGEVGTGGGTVGGTGEGEIDLPDPTPEPTTPRFTPRGPRAQGDPGRWVSTQEYPTRDEELGHEGLARVRLSVGSNGRVTGCEVTESSGWPGLDRASCTWLTRRARFEPATDSNGEQVTGHYNTSVRWRLPDE